MSDQELLEDDYDAGKLFTLPQLLDPTSDWTWQMESACTRYPTMDWFSAQGKERNTCKMICDTCVVKRDCLDFAVRNKINDGIWGGLEAKERRAQ